MTYTALVVDDNYYNRDLVCLALQNAGYTTVEAEDGLQALERLKSGQYDLLVLDLAMPNLDGMGVMQQMRYALYHPPRHVIVITAYADLVQGTVAAEADVMLFKPIQIQELAVIARELQTA